MPSIDDFNRLPDDVAHALRLAAEALAGDPAAGRARDELDQVRERYSAAGTVVTDDVVLAGDRRGTATDDVRVAPRCHEPVDERAVHAIAALAAPGLTFIDIIDAMRAIDVSDLALLSDESVTLAAVQAVHPHWPEHARCELASHIAQAARAPLRAAVLQLRHSGRLEVCQDAEAVVLQLDGAVVHEWIVLRDH